MKDKEILKLDVEFNFDGVFRRNYCSLLNIFTCEVTINYPYTVDGVIKNLTPPEGRLFSVQYREWMNEKQFELESGNYFSTSELAFDYFKNNQQKFGLVKIDRVEAISLAKESLKLQEETKSFLNKG